jgi:Ca2+/Na+ antiporter
MNVLLCTVFINIFGNALALRGPAGSMIRAITGMVEEQHQILASFLLTIVFFIVMCISMFFLVMDHTMAWTSSVTMLLCLYITYSYTLRIYNRFQISAASADWRAVDDELEELDPSLMVSATIDDVKKSLKAPLTNPTGSTTTYTGPTKKAKSKSVFRPPSKFFFGLYGKASTEKYNPNPGLTSAMLSSSQTSGGYVPPTVLYTGPGGDNFSDVNSKVESTELQRNFWSSSSNSRAMGAYLSYYQTSQSSTYLFKGDPWSLRYFVIKGSVMFFYKDKASFKDAPGQPINKRGIDLDGYTLKRDAEPPSFVFQIVVEDPEDNRRDWQFRCDTNDQYDRWVSMLKRVLEDRATVNA